EHPGSIARSVADRALELAGGVFHQSAAGRARRGARAAHSGLSAARRCALPCRCARHAPVRRRHAVAAVRALLRGQPLRLDRLAAYAVLAFAVGCLVTLVFWEIRMPDPVIPVRLLASPVIWRSNIVVACFAAALFGAVLYLPLYLQLGRGFGIGASGLLLLPITLSRAASYALTGRSIARSGKLTAYR